MQRRTLVAVLTTTGIWGAAVLTTTQGDTTTPCSVQGTGGASPVQGTVVAVEGIVTVRAPALDGFFIEAPGCDGDPATSDGLFVYDPAGAAAAQPGDILRAEGEVVEYYGLTEVRLGTATVTGSGEPPPPAELAIPADLGAARSYLEAHEGMLVRLPRARVVGATNSYGEAYVTTGDLTRLFRSSEDGRTMGLLPATDGAWLHLDHGDAVSGAVGALTYTFGHYKLAVPGALDVEPGGREPAPLPTGPDDTVRIGTYNLENFFDPVDDPGKNDADWTPTRAAYEAGVARRAASIARFLTDVDILVVQEVENYAVLKELADHEELADAHYDAVLFEGPDERGIDVGLLFDHRRLEVVAAVSRQACVDFQPAEPGEPCTMDGGGAGWSLYSRPPLVVTLQVVESGARVTVIGNHFKSKRGGDVATTPVRVAMAEHNRALLAAQKESAPDVPVVVLGDLNDFPDTAPIAALVGDGALVDLHRDVPAATDYTFVFNGVSQVLDYVLVEPDLPIASFGPVHVNVDYAASASAGDDATHRASDHDPVVLTTRLGRPTHLFLPAALRGATLAGGDEPTPVPPTATPSPTPTPAPGSPTPAAPPGSPLRIDTVFYDGEEPRLEGDEYVEFTNVSPASVVLAGWRLVSVRGGQVFTFPDIAIASTATCRVYTDEVHQEWCGLSWGSRGQAVWRNSGDKAELRDPGGRLIDWFCYGDHTEQCRGPARRDGAWDRVAPVRQRLSASPS